MPSRSEVEELDRGDELGPWRDRFVIDDPDLLYMDGNSLGRLPCATVERLHHVITEEWGRGLVRSWQEWIDLPQRVGDLLATALLGAEPGEVLACDSTSVNFYKLAVAAVGADPDRRVIVTDRDNFPTDRYLLEGIAAQQDLAIRWIEGDPVSGPDVESLSAALDEDVALVTLSHVAYRSGALADMDAITAAVHEVGALVLWDVSHSVGAVPIELSSTGADLAVGCTYKYVNAGPGAPAFLYVRRDLQDRLEQPLWGWMGQKDQFTMGPAYDPAPGITRYLVGTGSVLGLAAVEEGAKELHEAGIERLRAKGCALTDLVIRLTDAWLAPLGFEVVTPRNCVGRGSHVALRHDDAFRICRALIERAGVVPDFRAPDVVRIGPAPAYTRFVDVYDALQRIRDLVASGGHTDLPAARTKVT